MMIMMMVMMVMTTMVMMMMMKRKSRHQKGKKRSNPVKNCISGMLAPLSFPFYTIANQHNCKPTVQRNCKPTNTMQNNLRIVKE